MEISKGEWENLIKSSIKQYEKNALPLFFAFAILRGSQIITKESIGFVVFSLITFYAMYGVYTLYKYTSSTEHIRNQSRAQAIAIATIAVLSLPFTLTMTLEVVFAYFLLSLPIWNGVDVPEPQLS